MAYIAPDAALLPRHSLIIDGVRSDGGGASMSHIYPATGQATGQLQLASKADVGSAVAAARKAAPAWRALTGDKRRDLMFKLASLIEMNGKHLAQLSTIENGSTIMTTGYLSWDAAQKFRYFGGWADKIQGPYGEHVGRSRARLHQLRTLWRYRRNHPVEWAFIRNNDGGGARVGCGQLRRGQGA